MRLDGDANDDVARQLGHLGDREFGGRPGNLAFRVGTWLEANVRPRETEVIELLGIDLGELFGVERRAQVANRRRRRFRRVVPAAERHDQDRPAKTFCTGVDLQRVHAVSIGAGPLAVRWSIIRPPRRCKGESSTNGRLTRLPRDCTMSAIRLSEEDLAMYGKHWRSNTSHFASKEHFDFSMKNRAGSAPTVTRQDVAMAQNQNWFGRAVTVNQEQILER